MMPSGSVQNVHHPMMGPPPPPPCVNVSGVCFGFSRFFQFLGFFLLCCCRLCSCFVCVCVTVCVSVCVEFTDLKLNGSRIAVRG